MLRLCVSDLLFILLRRQLKRAAATCPFVQLNSAVTSWVGCVDVIRLCYRNFQAFCWFQLLFQDTICFRGPILFYYAFYNTHAVMLGTVIFVKILPLLLMNWIVDWRSCFLSVGLTIRISRNIMSKGMVDILLILLVHNSSRTTQSSEIKLS